MRTLTRTLALAAAIVSAVGCHKHEDHKHGGARPEALIAHGPRAESRSIDVIVTPTDGKTDEK